LNEEKASVIKALAVTAPSRGKASHPS